ncbi:hypothetical protein BS78_10G157900, partial [Paspalum vaginatum]
MHNNVGCRGSGSGVPLRGSGVPMHGRGAAPVLGEENTFPTTKGVTGGRGRGGVSSVRGCGRAWGGSASVRGPTSAGGRGGGRPPIPPTSVPYRSPRPAVGQIEGFSGSEQQYEQEPEASNSADHDVDDGDASGRAEWRKLKNGPPENLPELEIMFEHTAVDGSTSCTPGDYMDGGEYGGAENSPMSTTNTKRGGNSQNTVTSPRKKSRSPVVKIMK